MTLLTIVTPCFNEASNLRKCVLGVVESLGDLKFEHIFIDNASTDDSVEILANLKESFPHIRILRNSSNVGVFSSIQRALREVRTDWVIPFFAADLQDPPKVISEMLELQRATECDSVFAIREDRMESRVLLSLRTLFYRVLKMATKGSYVTGTSEFCLIRRTSVKQLLELQDPSPFLRIYLSQLRGNVRYVKYSMGARKGGKSSATIFTLLDDALNGLSLVLPSVFSRIMVMSFFSLIVGILVTVYATVDAFFLPLSYEGLLVVGITLIGFSFLMGLVSIVGHYIYLIHSNIRTANVATTKEHL